MDILTIIKENPGITGVGIHKKLVAQSKTAKWFGEGSFITALCGPNIGSMYVTIWKLEEQKRIKAMWGAPSRERGWRRPRHYYCYEEEVWTQK